MIDSLSVATKGFITSNDYVDNDSFTLAVEGFLPKLKDVVQQQLLSDSIVFIARKLLLNGDIITPGQYAFNALIERFTEGIDVNLQKLALVDTDSITFNINTITQNNTTQLVFNIDGIQLRNTQSNQIDVTQLTKVNLDDLTTSISSFKLNITDTSGRELRKLTLKSTLIANQDGYKLETRDTNNNKLKVEKFNFDKLD